MRSLGIRALLLGIMMSAPSVVRAQTHVYTLRGTFADQFGGPSLTSDGGILGPYGYSFGPNQGLALQNVFSAGADYSIVFRSTLSSVTSSTGYVKLVDFKDQTSDNGYYVYVGQSVFYPYNGSGFATDYVANVPVTTVLTNDATNHMVSVYVDGLLRLSISDGAQYAEFSGPNGIARFFEDDFYLGQPEAAAGFADYLATYNTVLSASDVANLQLPLAAPEPATLTLIATGLLGVAGVVRRRRKTLA